MRSGKYLGIIILDLLFMAINFSALTLFSSLKDFIVRTYHFRESELALAAVTYSMGIFFAFLIGHSRFFELRPRLTVLFAGLCASIPQLLIPITPNPQLIAALRFVQGLVMSAVPIFSYQAGRFFGVFRTLAMGSILSGIFIGGLVGSIVGPYLALYTGWKLTYYIFGVLMIVIAIIWTLITPSHALPPRRVEVVKEKRLSVWREKFTIVWGLTFFSGLWIVFTLAPLIHFIAEEQVGVPGFIASSVLESSYVTWSILAGVIALILCRHAKSRFAIFKGIAMTQIIQYILTIVGAIIALQANNPTTFLVSLVIVAAVQGTAPTFWSIPALAYPEEVASRAGYALGLISNSSALIGPITTLIITTLTVRGAWLLVVVLSIFGILVTYLATKLKLPIDKLGAT